MREADTLRNHNPAATRPAGWRRLWLAGAVLLAGAGIAVMIHRDDHTLDLDSTDAAPTLQSVRPSGERRAAGGTLPLDTTSFAMPGVAPQSALRRRFQQAEDLFAYSQVLAPMVRAGDADATWLMSRVVETCAAYAMDPAGYARDTELLGNMRLSTSSSMQAARERIARRCRRFTTSDGFSNAAATGLLLSAAKAGSLVAEAELLGLGQPLGSGEGYVRDLIGRVRDSLDAEAFRAIAPAMGGPAGVGMFSQPEVTPQYREIVWQLAACRLGMDCGPDSTLMTAYCVNGGICSRDTGQGFEAFVQDAAVPRQGADLIMGMVDTLVGDAKEH